MLRISEHFEYYHNDHISIFQKIENWENYFALSTLEDKINFEKNCVSISLNRNSEENKYFCSISSSYYIGLDRFPNLGANIYVEPKINNEEKQVNYVQMLLESLKEPENFEHLDGLISTKFNEDWIEIDNHLQPLLTPFLIAQFLSVVKDLVKKGLKKSYYEKVENLNNRVKGKVLVGQQIKQNILKNRYTKTICKFQEFGFDIELNQFLKFVLSCVSIHLEDYSKNSDIYKNLVEIQRYCNGGFHQVSDNTFSKLDFKESNPFFKNYNRAIQLGNQILALNDYNISKNSNKAKTLHPPFWIDMSKLFELFVFGRLRDRYSLEGEVQYHKKFNKQEPDFILNTNCGIKAVVDAKYKPRYLNGNPTMEDARQLAGYTRLNSVYRELGIENDDVISAYFIYPGNLTSTEKDQHTQEDFKVKEETEEIPLFESPFRVSSSYKKMYFQEINLLVN
jgi:5-methylcytosine-specific restriction enzyme subunit McrC